MSFQEFPPALMVLSPRLTTAGDPGSSVVGINTTPVADGAFTYCIANQFTYRLNKQSEATPDGITILTPLNGPGRWLASVSGLAGIWTAYTPSFNSQNADGAIGDGLIEGRFKVDGDTLSYSISLQWGATTNGGTGFLVFGMPPGVTIDNAKMLGFGVGLSSGIAAQSSVANQTFPLIQLAAADFGPPIGPVVAFGLSNSATGAFLEATSPFAFAAGDFIAIQGTVALV